MGWLYCNLISSHILINDYVPLIVAGAHRRGRLEIRARGRIVIERGGAIDVSGCGCCGGVGTDPTLRGRRLFAQLSPNSNRGGGGGQYGTGSDYENDTYDGLNSLCFATQGSSVEGRGLESSNDNQGGGGGGGSTALEGSWGGGGGGHGESGEPGGIPACGSGASGSRRDPNRHLLGPAAYGTANLLGTSGRGSGGRQMGQVVLDPPLLGNGGGGGGGSCNGSDGLGGRGGAGGGTIALVCRELIIQAGGAIRADGANGGSGKGIWGSGDGGGSGGAVLLCAGSLSLEPGAEISARGGLAGAAGQGVSASSVNAHGGKGGAGRIQLLFAEGGLQGTVVPLPLVTGSSGVTQKLPAVADSDRPLD